MVSGGRKENYEEDRRRGIEMTRSNEPETKVTDLTYEKISDVVLMYKIYYSLSISDSIRSNEYNRRYASWED
jgi:hypothetical protein